MRYVKSRLPSDSSQVMPTKGNIPAQETVQLLFDTWNVARAKTKCQRLHLGIFRFLYLDKNGLTMRRVHWIGLYGVVSVVLDEWDVADFFNIVQSVHESCIVDLQA